MSEMALTAEQVIIVGRGRLIADVSIAELTGRSRRSVAGQVAAGRTSCASVLAGPGVRITSAQTGVLEIEGLDTETVGRLAAAHGIALFELTARSASLEEAFMELTRDDVEYQAIATAGLTGMEGAPDDHHHDTASRTGQAGPADPGPGGLLGMDQAAVAAVDLVDAVDLRRHHDRHRRAAELARRRARRGRASIWRLVNWSRSASTAPTSRR